MHKSIQDELLRTLVLVGACELYSNVHRAPYNDKSLMMMVMDYMELTVIGDQGSVPCGYHATYMQVRDELRHAEFHTLWMSMSNEVVKG